MRSLSHLLAACLVTVACGGNVASQQPDPAPGNSRPGDAPSPRAEARAVQPGTQSRTSPGARSAAWTGARTGARPVARTGTRPVARTGARAAICSVGEPAWQRLALPGMAGVYVEPNALVEGDDGKVLLAGSPVYAFAFDSAGQPDVAPDPEILGVMIRDDGTVQAVPKPMDGHLAEPRALPLPGGGWEVVFAVDSTGEMGAVQYHLGARYGRFDGRRWSDLEDPFETARTPRYPSSTQLVRNSEGLWWLTGAPPGSSFSTRPSVLSRTARGWTWTAFPVGRAAYLELAASADDGELHALVVRPDTLAAFDRNSVYMYRKEASGWVEAQRLTRGGTEGAHNPVFGFHGSEWTAGWWVPVEGEGGGRSEARTTGPGDGGGVTHHVVDESIVTLRLTGFDENAIWVVDHPLPGGALELRVVQMRAGKSQVMKALPSPFTGPFIATALRTGELLVVGPLLDREAGMLSSLVLRFSIECGAAS